MGKKKIATYFAGADITRKIMMILIIVMMLTVVIFAVYKAINTPEKMTKDRIADYAREYYENYFYPKVKSSVSAESFESAMRNYAEKGVDNGRIALRQLMLFDGGRFKNELSTISEYCDIDQTYVEIFPEKPYNKENYHMKFNYSCEF